MFIIAQPQNNSKSPQIDEAITAAVNGDDITLIQHGFLVRVQVEGYGNTRLTPAWTRLQEIARTEPQKFVEVLGAVGAVLVRIANSTNDKKPEISLSIATEAAEAAAYIQAVAILSHILPDHVKPQHVNGGVLCTGDQRGAFTVTFDEAIRARSEETTYKTLTARKLAEDRQKTHTPMDEHEAFKQRIDALINGRPAEEWSQDKNVIDKLHKYAATLPAIIPLQGTDEFVANGIAYIKPTATGAICADLRGIFEITAEECEALRNGKIGYEWLAESKLDFSEMGEDDEIWFYVRTDDPFPLGSCFTVHKDKSATVLINDGEGTIMDFPAWGWEKLVKDFEGVKEA